MKSRREFLQWGAGVGAAAGLGGLVSTPTSAHAVPTVAQSLTPYLDPLPLLVDNAVDLTAGGGVSLRTALVSRRVHRQLRPTTLFGYLRSGGPAADDTGASYLGPVLVAKRGVPVTATYTDELAGDAYRQVFGPDSSYVQFLMDKEVRAQTHLHGGFVAGEDDGNPYATLPIASGATQTAHYPNEQRGSLLWYHDHYMGATRMNVVAGLAGGYVLRDEFDTGDNPDLPGAGYEIPLVIQDRSFTADGSLLYPTAPAAMNGPWIPEFFGDVMLVNGKAWPFLEAEPAVYRFRVLNGCNARILNLKWTAANGATVPMSIIGSDGGLLPLTPVPAKRLLLGPAERFDVLCDFTGLADQTVLLQNSNPPHPVVTPAPHLQKVMQVRVRKSASGGAPRTVLRHLPADPELESLLALGAPQLSGGRGVPLTHMVTLNEVGAETPGWTGNLNGVGYTDADPGTVTRIDEGAVQDWYYVNMTPDTHPMHVHLVTFRVLGRYSFDAKGYAAAYGGPNGVPGQDVDTLVPFLRSRLMPPDPEEVGFKDTVKANPGQVTVVRARFRLPSSAQGTATGSQKYVHHCHILEHEDNDMMERFEVVPKKAAPGPSDHQVLRASTPRS